MTLFIHTLRAARRAVLGGLPWQRYQFHLQRNASADVPKQEMKASVTADLRAVFNAQDRTQAEALLKRTVQKYEATAPNLAAWLEENLPKGLAVFAFPEPHRLLRTTNGVERVNREVKRRTQLASICPNEASCLRQTNVSETLKWVLADRRLCEEPQSYHRHCLR